MNQLSRSGGYSTPRILNFAVTTHYLINLGYAAIVALARYCEQTVEGGEGYTSI